MFSYIIIVNDNGELKSIAEKEFMRALNDHLDEHEDFTTTRISVALNHILDERSAREGDELGRFGVKTTPRT